MFSFPLKPFPTLIRRATHTCNSFKFSLQPYFTLSKAPTHMHHMYKLTIFSFSFQPYMTLHRGPTHNSIRRESLKSLSLQRRTSSSTSSTQGRLEDRMATNNSLDVISDSLRDKLLSRNNFTTLDISKYTSRNLEIPSIITEESKTYYSPSRSRSDCTLH